MSQTTAIFLFGLTCSGLTALLVSLAWYRPLHASRKQHAHTFARLLDEQLAHAQTRQAHQACCQDLRRRGISGKQRHLHSV